VVVAIKKARPAAETVEAPAADIIIDPNQFPEDGLVTIDMEAPSNE